MSVSGVIESLQQGLSGRSEPSLVFRADVDSASVFTLGKIIKGKVMRHYEGQRYGVRFNGHEKVVDTTFPLKDGEIIYARVIGIDEKVHLQRVMGDSKPEGGRDGQVEKYRPDRRPDSIVALFDKYQAKLSPAEHNLILQLQNTLGGSRHVAVGALILAKLGVALEPGLIRAIHRVLADTTTDMRISPLKYQAYSVSDSLPETMVQGLAVLLGDISDKGPALTCDESCQDGAGAAGAREFDLDGLNSNLADNNFGEGRNKEQLEWFLGQWLLNTQCEGAVAHRFLRFPLWFSGQLTEVTLALFAQQESSDDGQKGGNAKLRFRNAVFALDTANLGHLQIKAKMADHHVSIDVTADSEAAAEYLGSKMSLLKSALELYGWRIDEIRYRVEVETGRPLQAVIEHYITQDSLNRLL